MASKNRDLRTGLSVWQGRRRPSVPHNRLRRDVACDVLVVGAGISGALTAELLAADGHKVIIVDRRGPFQGSTSANTALIMHEIDTPLTHLSRKVGEADAVRAWRRSYLAVQSLAARTRALRIACGLVARDSVYLSGEVLDSAGLRREAEARAAAGIHTDYLTHTALREQLGIERRSGLRSFGSFAADPRRMTAGYLRAAVARGARLYAPLDVIDVKAAARSVHARSSEGQTITCGHLVFATGYEVPRGATAKGHRIASTYALATAPQAGRLWPEHCLIWEAAAPYLYIRTTGDGRIVAGGEDEEIADADARDALLSKKVAAIRSKVGRLLPAIDTTPVFQWTGTFGTTTTGLPLIGEIPGMKNCWAVLGYGGNGITYSRIAAEIIRSAFAGKRDADATSTRSQRSRGLAREFLSES
jgi:glycine/D-amino acid oxidase-like deaminating enzyme